MIGGWLEDGLRIVGGWLEDGWKMVGRWLEDDRRRGSLKKVDGSR